MVPSVFECAAEPKIAEIDIANGGCNPQAILEKHWDTFVTQQDFNYLASIGINTVRLPIGYWSLGPNFVQDTPFANVSSVYENAWPHVVRAINMAELSNIAVIVDLHGAPGSQNGQVRGYDLEDIPLTFHYLWPIASLGYIRWKGKSVRQLHVSRKDTASCSISRNGTVLRFQCSRSPDFKRTGRLF